MNETNNNNNFSQNIWMEIFFHQIFIITNPCITNIVISNKKLNSCRRRCFFKQIFAKDYLFGAIYTVFTKKLWRWSSIQNAFLSSRLKKYGSGLSWRWALLTAWAFGFLWEQDSILSLILHLNQPRSVLFSLSRVEDLAAVNHVTQAVVRVGSKIGS